MEYDFTKFSNEGLIEDFEKNDNNIACFKVFDHLDNDISEQIVYVVIFLNNNALIGLGTELIRLAHNYEEGKEVHVMSTSKEREPQQSMGIFLKPGSCDLIIKCQSSKTVDELLQECKKMDRQDKKQPIN